LTRYYLGVDGGGTNCRIRLADENLRTLGEGRGGPSNLQLQNADPAYESILEGSKQAFAAAGLWTHLAGTPAINATALCLSAAALWVLSVSVEA